MKYCGECGTAIQPQDEKCSSCGADLTPQRAVVGLAPSPLAVLTGKTCPRCSAAVSRDARECFQCHARFATTSELMPRQLRREIRWGVFQGILLVAAIVLSAYILVLVAVLALAGSVGS